MSLFWRMRSTTSEEGSSERPSASLICPKCGAVEEAGVATSAVELELDEPFYREETIGKWKKEDEVCIFSN